MASDPAAYVLQSVEFRRERQAAWQELEAILAKVDRRGLAALSADELYRLPALYRGAVSSLSVARSISLDRALVAYLDNLAARAYVTVYGSKRGYASALADFFLRRFPGLVWTMRRHLAVAVLLLVAGAVTGFHLTTADPEHFFALVPEAMAQGRDPSSSRDELLRGLRGGGPRDGGEGGERGEAGDPGGGDGDGSGEDGEAGRRHGGLSVFAGFLFTHNARIGMACFALGFAAGVPVALLLFGNGVLLGAFAAIHHRQDLAVELWGWLLPHGITELLAVCLCGAAGLAIGQALVFPGRARRLDALAAAGRRSAAVVLGSLVLFLLAGLIEGYFRQLVLSEAPRYAMAAATALLWALYFGVLGRRAAAAPQGGREGGREAPW